MKSAHGFTPREHIQDVLDEMRYAPRFHTPTRYTAMRWFERGRWRLLKALCDESRSRMGCIFRKRVRLRKLRRYGSAWA